MLLYHANVIHFCFRILPSLINLPDVIRKGGWVWGAVCVKNDVQVDVNFSGRSSLKFYVDHHFYVDVRLKFKAFKSTFTF